MLSIKVLEIKTTFQKPGESTPIMDLSEASIQFRQEIDVIETIIVPKDFEMRPDLIAKVEYGDSNKLDIICKTNGISNPFTVFEGQILYVVSDSQFNDAYVHRVPKEADVREKFFDANRLSKKDQKRLEYIKNKAAGTENGSSTNLPPNFANPGSKEIKVKDGKVMFGDDVAGNKDNCPVTQSRAKVKAKLLQNKIFKT